MNKVFTYVLKLEFALFCIIIIIHQGGKPNYPINPNTDILIAKDSSKNYNDQFFQHNSELISLLQERETTGDNLTSSSEEGRRQTKTIYIAVFAILIPTLLNKDRINKIPILIGLSIYIMIMYGLDVHQEDMFKRGQLTQGITHHALESLIDTTAKGNIRYLLNYKAASAQWDSAGKSMSDRFYRKLWYAGDMNPEHVVYYIIPWVLLFFYSVCKLYNLSILKFYNDLKLRICRIFKENNL